MCIRDRISRGCCRFGRNGNSFTAPAADHSRFSSPLPFVGEGLGERAESERSTRPWHRSRQHANLSCAVAKPTPKPTAARTCHRHLTSWQKLRRQIARFDFRLQVNITDTAIMARFGIRPGVMDEELNAHCPALSHRSSTTGCTPSSPFAGTAQQISTPPSSGSSAGGLG